MTPTRATSAFAGSGSHDEQFSDRLNDPHIIGFATVPARALETLRHALSGRDVGPLGAALALVGEARPMSAVPSQEALECGREIRLEAVVELADLAASYWRSIAEAAFRGEQLTLEVHCRHVAAVTREAFAVVKTLGAATTGSLSMKNRIAPHDGEKVGAAHE
jgi:hypothetical protein